MKKPLYRKIVLPKDDVIKSPASPFVWSVYEPKIGSIVVFGVS